jgi:NAD(P)-dependent dehydrogenase (short-subunit alcohol dehydrogenase family)
MWRPARWSRRAERESGINVPKWTAADIPDLHGRTAVVTGANTGLGFHTARGLAHAGAAVVLACRNTDKAQGAVDRIRAENPRGPLSIVRLDLSALPSVREAAEQIRAEHDRLDLLVNNAGTGSMHRELNTDGHESTFATNHLGPFALTGLLLDRLAPVAGARIVTVSSDSHKFGEIDFDDMHFATRKYTKWASYGQSKLANLLFTFELQRRLAAAGMPAISVAAHPGAADTEFGDDMGGVVGLMSKPAMRPLVSWMLQTAEGGALITLRAAVDPEVSGGDYFGPGGLLGLRGAPVLVSPSERARDENLQRRLWAECERLTGVTYSLGETESSDR